MPMTKSGLRLLIIGFVIMLAGYALLCGGGSKDPAVFNCAMFDFRRLVAAPLVMMAGIVVEILAIMRVSKKEGE